MILSDESIADHLLRPQGITVEPTPSQEQIQPASLDVRLGEEFIDPRTGFTSIEEESIVLQPGDRFLGTTAESVSLPDDIAAQLTGRSSLGRLFVTVHQTAGWIDPGWSGDITLEIANFGRDMQTLNVGDRVAQLVFFPLDTPSSGYDGQYQDQEGAVESGGL